LIHMMTKAGEPKVNELQYLFLGDYVDRGIEGIEVCLFLFMSKILTPSAVTLLRGNHESRSMTTSFTFRDEVLERYDMEIFDLFMDTFDMLPIAAYIGSRYLCVHGGISKDLKKLEEINKIDRF
jgi:serine/threonine-protein phosphatase 2B catalytic subunit